MNPYIREFKLQEDISMSETKNEDKALEKVKVAFEKAVGAGKNEDEIKMAMINAGATFKNVSRMYTDLCVSSGLITSKDKKAEIVAAVMAKAKVDNEEGLKTAIDNVVSKCKGVSEKAAAGLIRSYCKKNEIDMYKRPKGAGGSSGFASKFYGFLRSNPKASEADAAKFINGEGDYEDTSENVKRHLSHYQAIRKLCNDIASGNKAA